MHISAYHHSTFSTLPLDGAPKSRHAIARDVLAEYEKLPAPGDYHDYSYLKLWLAEQREKNEKS